MGINGLHKALGFATKKSNIASFAGKTVAIDTSSWLHKSVYSVASRYVESMERKTNDPQSVQASVRYIALRCTELLGPFGIAKIFLVMDGERCPLKADTNQDRELRRMENLRIARECLRVGQRQKAEDKYRSCIKIRDQFTNAVLALVAKQFAKDGRVQLVWSPYEADAQLAKLCVDGVADAVITEDSDVLLYSATSHVPFPLLFKLDRSTGCCDEVSMSWLLNPSSFLQSSSPSANAIATKTGKRGAKKGQPSAMELVFRTFAQRQLRKPGFGVRLFVQACVLAGCDYAINELSGVGLVNAFKAVRDNAHRTNETRFQKVLATLSRRATMGIDLKAYESQLSKSEAVFYFHVVRGMGGGTCTFLELPDQDRSIVGSNELDGREAPCAQYPCLERYGSDVSFFGTPRTPNATKKVVDEGLGDVNDRQRIHTPPAKHDPQPDALAGSMGPPCVPSDLRQALEKFARPKTHPYTSPLTVSTSSSTATRPSSTSSIFSSYSASSSLSVSSGSRRSTPEISAVRSARRHSSISSSPSSFTGEKTISHTSSSLIRNPYKQLSHQSEERQVPQHEGPGQTQTMNPFSKSQRGQTPQKKARSSTSSSIQKFFSPASTETSISTNAETGAKRHFGTTSALRSRRDSRQSYTTRTTNGSLFSLVQQRCNPASLTTPASDENRRNGECFIPSVTPESDDNPASSSLSLSSSSSSSSSLIHESSEKSAAALSSAPSLSPMATFDYGPNNHQHALRSIINLNEPPTPPSLIDKDRSLGQRGRSEVIDVIDVDAENDPDVTMAMKGSQDQSQATMICSESQQGSSSLFFDTNQSDSRMSVESICSNYSNTIDLTQSSTPEQSTTTSRFFNKARNTTEVCKVTLDWSGQATAGKGTASAKSRSQSGEDVASTGSDGNSLSSPDHSDHESSDDDDGFIHTPDSSPARKPQSAHTTFRRLYEQTSKVSSRPLGQKHKAMGPLASAFERQKTLFRRKSVGTGLPKTAGSTRPTIGVKRRRMLMRSATAPASMTPVTAAAAQSTTSTRKNAKTNANESSSALSTTASSSSSSSAKRSKYFQSTKKTLFAQLKVHVRHPDDDF